MFIISVSLGSEYAISSPLPHNTRLDLQSKGTNISTNNNPAVALMGCQIQSLERYYLAQFHSPDTYDVRLSVGYYGKPPSLPPSLPKQPPQPPILTNPPPHPQAAA